MLRPTFLKVVQGIHCRWAPHGGVDVVPRLPRAVGVCLEVVVEEVSGVDGLEGGEEVVLLVVPPPNGDV